MPRIGQRADLTRMGHGRASALRYSAPVQSQITLAPPLDVSTAGTTGRGRGKVAMGIGWLCASVLLHGCVLGAVWPQGARATAMVSSSPALHVRMLGTAQTPELSQPLQSASVVAAEPKMTVAPVAPTTRVATHTGTTQRAVLLEAALPMYLPDAPLPDAPSPSALPVIALEASADAPAAPVAESVGSARPTTDEGALSAPTYRTAPPPAMRLSYELRHGMLSGQGVIDWHPSGGQYELRLEGRIASLTLLTQVSTGGFDAHGLAPVRYTDQRMKRAANAANLQRATGRITFSGPSTEYPLLPGTQDRVSWMVQLAAIVNAEPALAKAGAEITLFVVGARGEGDIWVFRCVGDESVDTGLGPMAAVKFTREPTKPHDTQVEAWLAPKLHGLPAHARLSNGSDGALDLVLREVQ